ncbi:hypothetical protein HanIR_Chr15g0768601 [Helianthus annuus]|nr:hypothetical protein HanIR_Chr15g0768601 [Helianthus annuus]
MLMRTVPLPTTRSFFLSPRLTSTANDSSRLVKLSLTPVMWFEHPESKNQRRLECSSISSVNIINRFGCSSSVS